MGYRFVDEEPSPQPKSRYRFVDEEPAPASFEKRLELALPKSSGIYGAGKEAAKSFLRAQHNVGEVGGKVAKALLVDPMVQAGETIGKTAAYPFQSKEAIATDPTLTPTTGQLIGAGLQVASAIPAVRGAGLVTKGLGRVAPTLSPAVTAGIGQAVAGGLTGYAYEAGEKLQKGEAPTPGLITAAGAILPYGISKAAQVDVGKPFIKAGTAIKDVFSPQAERLRNSMEKIITKNFRHAISPSSASVGKTFAQSKNYDKKTVTSVINIVEDKPNLQLSARSGEIQVGSLPESVAQLDEAMPQTMKRIYTNFNALAKETGQKGIGIDMSPTIKELEFIANDANLRIKNPVAVRYAKGLAERIRKEGMTRTPESVEDLITSFNRDLNAFYKTPSYEKASNAYVDSMGVNKLRQTLDETIGKATGANYQKLKNDYGSMRAIQNDITKKKIMLANKAGAGVVEQLTNIASGQQVARGLVTLDPTTLATAGAMKGIERWHKYVWNPDRMIKKMFTQTERLLEKSKGLPREGIKKVLEPSSSPYKYTPAGLEEGAKMKALSPPKPETWITGEGFAMRETMPPTAQPQYPPFAGVRVEQPAQVIRKAINEGWSAVKGDKTPLLLVDKSGRQVAWNSEARKFLPVEKPYSDYQLGQMKDVTDTLYGLGGVEGEALPKNQYKKGLYSK